MHWAMYYEYLGTSLMSRIRKECPDRPKRIDHHACVYPSHHLYHSGKNKEGREGGWRKIIIARSIAFSLFVFQTSFEVYAVGR